MSLVKNEIPILEYDTDKKAIISPGNEGMFKFPKKAVFLAMDNELTDYIMDNDCEVIDSFEGIMKTFFVYKTVYKNTEICLCQAPLGSAAATQIMEQLISGGVKHIVAAGCCGALVNDTEGEFFIPTAALRQEGVSYQYLPPSREVKIKENAVEAIEKALIDGNYKYTKCKTWTTDAFYRETKEMVLYRRQEGYSVVEQECAALAACAEFRDILFGQLLFTSDSLANVNRYDRRNWGNNSFRKALKLALESVVEMG